MRHLRKAFVYLLGTWFRLLIEAACNLKRQWFELKTFHILKLESYLLHNFVLIDFNGWSTIIIIIMSRYQHGYSWPSLATTPYHSLLLADPQGSIPYQHGVAVCRFELDVLPLLVHVKRSTGVHHSRALSYFSSSGPRVWFV